MLFKMMCFVIVFSVFVSGLNFVFAQDNKSFCKTPRDLPGECKDITSCQSLLSIVQNRPINSANADYLKKSKCGALDDSRKVCCPKTDEIKSESVSLSTPSKSDETAKPVSSLLLPDHKTCGIDSPNKIFGGKKTDIREFPWMVLVENRGHNDCHTYCGGVLINTRYVLTAAHCLKGMGVRPSCTITTVRLGEYNIDTDPDCAEEINGCAPPVRILPVEEKIVHEDYNRYNPNGYHDVALLRLTEKVNYTAYIQPICLPITAHDLSQNFTGRKLTAAGWGQTENATRLNSAEKLKVKLPVKENEFCTKVYQSSNIHLNEGQMCVGGEKGEDSCKRDSGGPLMDMYADRNGTINWYSIGIVSYGTKDCGSEGFPGVYVKVANYVSWIVGKLRD